MYFAVDDNANQLEHHGIKGQRWGVRRFQREDGTRTAAGKKREQANSSEDTQNSGSGFHIDKKKAVIAGAAIAGALLIANPTTRNALVKYGSTAVKNLPKAVGSTAGRLAAKTVNKIEKGAEKAEDAMLNAALAAVGTVAIAKISAKLEPPPDATQGEKDKSKILTDIASAGVRSVTNGGNSKGNGNNNNNSNSNVKVDKSSKEYQNLFNQNMSSQDREKIKKAANNGASMEELQKMSRELGHTDLSEWIHASEFGSLIL